MREADTPSDRAGDTGGADGPPLQRSIGMTQMAFYALGSMLGAGIYGLIGKAAGQMGNAIWLAFLVSMVAALLTGLSYASIASRYPKAAGAAYVTQRAYRQAMLTYVVGLAVMCSGLTSVATQSRVVAENLQQLGMLEGVPLTMLALGFLLLLAGIVFRGIRECMWLNVLCTTVEAFGLILVIAVGFSYWGSVDLLETPPPPDTIGGAAGGASGGVGGITALLVMQGAVLTFFSFIGFEDSINVAEEVKNPRKVLPWGIMLAMVAATLIYIAVSITAVSVVPWQELSGAAGPLTEVVRRAAPWFPPVAFLGITVFAVTNTALLNYVTASRLAYGMARQGLLPDVLRRVHRTRRTPHVAVLVLLAMITGLALLGDITQLASATVLLLLLVFAIVNGALVILKLRPGEPPGGFEVPIFVPALGAVVCAALLVNRFATGDWQAPMIAGGILAGILGLYALMRPRHVEEDDLAAAAQAEPAE
ncbi:APC family permease [Skermanella mucosa]|uniref:APC family permease n=1 Tax=Skermanella mucosa TaxID=1789672 RepID=UPI00192B49D7|nr:amino acid permease [Skermanella mucosa]UEM21195.1 APC family permease [Skermanella mucosa]